MEFTVRDLENLAELARIELKEGEKDKMLEDFKSILNYVGEINKVSGTETSEKSVTRNVVRDDIVANNSNEKAATLLDEAPDKENGFVKVTKVLN